MKMCSSCGVTQPIKDFHVATANKDGRSGKCKTCKKLYNSQYRERNKERLRQAALDRYLKNRTQYIEKQKKYYERNKERIREYQIEYRKRNAENSKFYKNMVAILNEGRSPDEVEEQRLRLRPQQLKKCSLCRTEKPFESFYSLRRSIDGLSGMCSVCSRSRTYTGTLRRTLGFSEEEFFLQKCAYCDKRALHVDHFLPRSLGGGDDKHNLVPSCDVCNIRKSDTHPLLWLGEDEFRRVVSEYNLKLTINHNQEGSNGND